MRGDFARGASHLNRAPSGAGEAAVTAPCTTCNQTDPNQSCMDCYDEDPMTPSKPNRQDRLLTNSNPWHVWARCPDCGELPSQCEGHTLRDHAARLGWQLLAAAVLLTGVWLGCHALGLAQWLCGVAD